MSERLSIRDLQTTPHRQYELIDSMWRARVTIMIETDPSIVVSEGAAARVMTALLACLAGYPFKDVACVKLDQPLGKPRSELRTEYAVRASTDPLITGKVTFIVEEDMALDGDAETYQRMEASRQNLLQFGGALQLWLNLRLPI